MKKFNVHILGGEEGIAYSRDTEMVTLTCEGRTITLTSDKVEQLIDEESCDQSPVPVYVYFGQGEKAVLGYVSQEDWAAIEGGKLQSFKLTQVDSKDEFIIRWWTVQYVVRRETA